jgi:hypothetical protein
MYFIYNVYKRYQTHLHIKFQMCSVFAYQANYTLRLNAVSLISPLCVKFMVNIKKIRHIIRFSLLIYFQDQIKQCFSNWVPRNYGVPWNENVDFCPREIRYFSSQSNGTWFFSTAIIHVRCTIKGADPSGRTHDLKSKSAPGRLLRSRIQPEAYVWAFFVPGRSLFVGLITLPKASCLVWCVWLRARGCDIEDALVHWVLSRHEKKFPISENKTTVSKSCSVSLNDVTLIFNPNHRNI